MIIWRDQLVNIINTRVPLNFQNFISYSVRIICDYANSHTSENENDAITQREV